MTYAALALGQCQCNTADRRGSLKHDKKDVSLWPDVSDVARY